MLAKAVRFIENNSDIIETLVDDLMQEQMHDAVEAVCRHHLDIGTEKQNTRMVAFASLTLGELLSKEKASEARTYLQNAYDLYTQDS